jgi:hypothetical protein
MAQNIGLTITLGGVDVVVRTVKELEDAIRKARIELDSTAEIGTKAYSDLEKQLNTAEGKLKDLKKASEGTDLERKLGDFAKVGGAITSSFAAAQAAVNLFGGDAEKVSEAAAQAQNLLTIALTARSVAEGIVGLKTVKTTIATVAQTAATNASTVATRALYTVIAANPFGALLAVIGLVVGALVLFTDESKKAKEAEEQFQLVLKNANEEQERKIRLLRATGSTAREIAEQEAKDAENNFKKAEFYLLNTAKNSEFYAQRKKERDEAELVFLEKKKVVDDMIAADTEKNEKELEENRKKRGEANKQRREKELEALLEQIRLTEELNRAELLRLSTGQKFVDLGITFELEKQNAEFLRLKGVLGDTSTVLEKYSKTFKDSTEKDKLVLMGYTEEWEKSKKLLGEGIIDGIITPEQFTKIESERSKFETNIKLVSEAFNNAKTSIQQVDFAKAVKAQLEIEQGVGKTFEELQDARINFSNLQKQFVADYVNANTDFSKSSAEVKVQQEELTKTANEYFKQIVDNQKQVLLYEDAQKKLTLQFQLAENANKNFVTSGEAVNGFIRENIDLITDSLKVDVQAISLNQQGIIALEQAILGKRKDVYQMFAYDVELIEKELANAGIDISKASEEEKLRILYEYIKKRQSLLGGEVKNFLEQVEKDIQAFRGAFNAIGQTVAQGFSFDFEFLELQYQNTLDNIVGDTVEANKKRAEAEKIYQGQVEALQKRQAKFNLQLTLTQAIADAAAAIITITKQTGVFATIAASIAAAATAVQIQQITQQLNRIDSFKRGGFVKGQGGLVVGPSHEYGGVKFQNGGVELEGGEAVINRVSSVRYGELLNSINIAGGGKPLMVNNFDDSRIVEAIAKQRSEPLRAYVLEQDITQKQAINKRLEQLAQI